MDVDTVEPGVDFVRAIEKAVSDCDVLVALIGKRWVGGEVPGVSRLDNTKDYVRLEVSTALARDIRVIPVLVDGMTMPNEDSLPSPVQPVTQRNAIEVSNTRFNFDIERLITAVRKVLNEKEAKRKADEEAERNRLEQEAEQRRREAEARRKAEEEPLRQQQRQRAEEEAKLKADDETRRRIEEEKSRAQQEAARAQQPERQKQRDQGAHTTPHHDSQPGPSPSLSSSKTSLWVGGSIITIVLALAFVFFLYPIHRDGPTGFSTAKSIAEGATLSGSLVPGQERHFFQFTASSPKTRVIVRKRSKAGFQGAVDVYDQNEKRVAQVREGVSLLSGINPEDQPLTLAFESRPGALYYIMVSVLASKTRGDYELTVRKEEVKQQVTQAQSPDARSSALNTSITTAKSIAEGATLSGSLVPGQERHFFQFTASSPKTRVIVRKRSKAGFQGAVDVYDQNEKRVAQVREGVSLLSGINPEDQPLTLAFESRPGALYYIMVSVLASNARGDYELTVRKE